MISFFFFNDTATTEIYTLSLHDALPISIKQSRKRGLKMLNLWGGNEDITDTRHPWHGLTVFKRGFGAQQKTYLPSYDYVISLGYWKTYIYEQAVEYLRGYKKVGAWRSPSFLRQLFGV